MLSRICMSFKGHNSNSFEKSTFSQTEVNNLANRQETGTQHSEFNDKYSSQNIINEICKSLSSAHGNTNGQYQIPDRLSHKTNHISRRIIRDIILHLPEVEEIIADLAFNVTVENCDKIVKNEAVNHIHYRALQKIRSKEPELIPRNVPVKKEIEINPFWREIMRDSENGYNLYKNLKTQYNKNPKFVVSTYEEKSKQCTYSVGPGTGTSAGSSITKRYSVKKYRIFNTGDHKNSKSDTNAILCDISLSSEQQSIVSDGRNVDDDDVYVDVTKETFRNGQTKSRGSKSFRNNQFYFVNKTKKNHKLIYPTIFKQQVSACGENKVVPKLSDSESVVNQIIEKHEDNLQKRKIIKWPSEKESFIVLDFENIDSVNKENQCSVNLDTMHCDGKNIIKNECDVIQAPVSISIPLRNSSKKAFIRIDQSNINISISDEKLTHFSIMCDGNTNDSIENRNHSQQCIFDKSTCYNHDSLTISEVLSETNTNTIDLYSEHTKSTSFKNIIRKPNLNQNSKKQRLLIIPKIKQVK